MSEVAGRKRLRLCIFGPAHHIHVSRWARFFAEYGYRVFVISPTRARIPGVTVIPLITAKKRESFHHIEFALWLKVIRSDILHVHCGENGWYAYQSGKRPYIVTVWGSDIYRIPDAPDPYQLKTIEALQNADLVTCDSNDQERVLLRLGVSPERIGVVQWGVDTCMFRPLEPTDKLRKELNIPETSQIILSMRQIGEVYNIETIFRAFALISHTDAFLIQKYYTWVQERFEKLDRLARDLGIADRLRWVGEMDYDRLPALYNLADVAVSVPSSDGTAMTVLEAMSCSVPLVVSDLPSTREWVVNEHNGLIVPPRSVEPLANSISRLLDNPEQARHMALNGLQLVRDKASQEVHMRGMANLYEALACKATKDSPGVLTTRSRPENISAHDLRQ